MSRSREHRLRLYNTRTGTTEAFAPLRPDGVRVYVCGLTPSAEAHLGHARSFMFFDVVRRYLVHLGYRVKYVQNVTDIDDRSIATARETGRDWREIVESFFASFKRSMTRLHVLEPDVEPRATAYISEIIEMIDALIDAGHAYVVDDGIYYKVKSFPRYGALSGRNVDELLVGARIAADENKEDPLDFALWKFQKPGEPAWPSPWGDGRPGWHIECSAMSRALLGEPFDIHGGGYDLVFPHHENEIAQSEPLMAKPPMANVWMHGGLLQFDGKKMSKSLGNFEPLSQLLDRHDAQAIRLLFLQTGYRKPMNFTEESVHGSGTALRRLLGAYDALKAVPPSAQRETIAASSLSEYERRFYDAMDDDLNTSGAVSVLFDLAAAANGFLERGAASHAAGFLHEKMTLLGISPSERSAAFDASRVEERQVTVTLAGGRSLDAYVLRGPEDADRRLGAALAERLLSAAGELAPLNGSVGDDIRALIVERARAKGDKDFARADALRAALAAAGITLKDRKDGVEWNVDA
ncbi:MAG: cysteine--tRNA ligase [Candidatus Eremiobacteraeota bacterium]|nr:cysteine--tRNA ligase [Candidatus Eremiobacteraeota bacterium]